ncbi:E3 ubiquitin-protein ligase parkin [Sitodiplosis mosellana]|uniref:E3 ubiquitin-protein ligase parkin n=1 Tax=Sitodiplosis mosellana TaxID=263140 RepID=UPI002443C3E2|nr:E3 ubiquitin-protein ligase parkin [Sitodiplosis mosellana]
MSFIINFLKNFLHNMLQLLSFGKKTIKNTLSIYVKFNRDTLSVDLDPHWVIREVKEFVAPQLGLQPNEVKIIFAGKELSDTTKLEECDLGQQSILHAVKARSQPISKRSLNVPTNSSIEEEPNEEHDATKPLSQTLTDLQFSDVTHDNRTDKEKRNEGEEMKARFFLYCSHCNDLCPGKLRVRCSLCKGGAFTVYKDPEGWDDVLLPNRIPGLCETNEISCTRDNGELPFAEFYFKCAKHTSMGEKDFGAPLSLIKRNVKQIPCLSCTDVCDPILVFPCHAGHVTCLDCFRQYCLTRLMERQFISHDDIGYTLPCPAGCENSFIIEIHHFKLLTKEQYDRYQRFATEEYVLKAGGVLCPQPDCGMGFIVDPDCKKITCSNGCGFVFCRDCLQGYHIGDCIPDDGTNATSNHSQYSFDPLRATEARWDDASRVTIKVISKPCPKCRTPTERDGGCMHIVCTRSGCSFEWCWVCQAEWTRDCMAQHWF